MQPRCISLIPRSIVASMSGMITAGALCGRGVGLVGRRRLAVVTASDAFRDCIHSRLGYAPWKQTRLRMQRPASQDDQAAVSDVQPGSNMIEQEATPVPDAPKKVDNVPYWLIGGLACTGVLETVYLTVVKVTGGQVACPASGSCASVLDSAYGSAFGVPLSALGAAGYLLVLLLAAQGAAASAAGQTLGTAPRLALGVSAATLSSCSLYLMYVLFAKLGGQPCTWCFTSAALSLGIATATVWGFNMQQRAQLALPGSLAAAAVVVLLAKAQASQAEIRIPYNLPIVTTESPRGAVELSRRLSAAGAKMYGAFWCSHCFYQKEAFGAQAMMEGGFPYVECYPNGYRTGEKIADVCDKAGVEAFPTWIINGQKHEGEMTFEEIEEALTAAPAVADAAA